MLRKVKAVRDILGKALEVEDPLRRKLARYEAHQIWMSRIPGFEFETDMERPCLEELRYPVQRALESSKDFTSKQDQLLHDVLDRASRYRELCLGEREGMHMVDELEDAGIPVSPPEAKALTELISMIPEEGMERLAEASQDFINESVARGLIQDK